MKKNLLMAFGLLGCVLRASAEPTTFASEFSIPEGTSIPKGNLSLSQVVAACRNDVAPLASDPDTDSNAAALIAAKKTLTASAS